MAAELPSPTAPYAFVFRRRNRQPICRKAGLRVAPTRSDSASMVTFMHVKRNAGMRARAARRVRGATTLTGLSLGWDAFACEERGAELAIGLRVMVLGL